MDKNLTQLVEKDSSFLRLAQDIDRGHFFHAQLICTEDEQYAKELCVLCMQKILQKNGLQNLCHKLVNGTFLDLLILEDPKSIKVEDLSLLLEQSSKKGIESDFKFFLVLGADRMTVEAQNKLLKTLEEPNPNQFFFVCVPSRFLVLQTIVSRCNVVEIESPKKEDVSLFLQTNFGVAKQDAMLATEISLGNTSKAIWALETKSTSFELAKEILLKINSSADCVKFATKLQKSDLNEVLQFAEFLILDLAKIKTNSSKLWFESQKEVINQISISQKGIIFVYDSIQKIKKLAKANVSQAALADKLALAIAEGKHI